jgi:NhaP-type Na+/H+ or K+/H+ antiporter
MDTLNIALVVLGGVVLVLGLFSGLIKNRLFISEPLIALCVGVLVGPLVFHVIDVANWGDQLTIFEQVARLTLAVSLMGVAIRLPNQYIVRYWKSVAIMLLVIMPLMWLVSGMLTYLLLPAVSLWVALLIGAVVTPTDPVVASSIVTGDLAEENIPGRVRHILSAESGSNDGLAFPLVMLPILILTRPTGEAVMHWLSYTLLWEVIGAVLLGGIIGYGAGHLQQWAQRTFSSSMERSSLLTVTLALALVVLGLVKLLGSDGILAVFAAGITFNMVVQGQEKARQENTQEVVKRFFDLPIFVLLGMALPWEQWLNLGWSGLLLVVAILLLRRLPAVLLFYRGVGQLAYLRDALFTGWFGPIGVAALFYATLGMHETQLGIVWDVGTLVITASLVVHGLSATPLTMLYGKVDQRKQQEQQSARVASSSGVKQGNQPLAEHH